MFYCTRRAVPLIKAVGRRVDRQPLLGRRPARLPAALALRGEQWAVVGFTKSLAIELGPAKIRVNCIQPGIVEGARIDRVIDAKARALNLSFDEMKQKLRRRHLAALDRHRRRHRRDGAVRLLQRRRAITGQALSVCADVQVLT